MDVDREERFEEIVKQIIKSMDPGYVTKHVQDRVTAISHFITDIVKIVEERSPQLKVSEILPVGGFTEGTKIKAADEFDFLVVVDELSRPGVVTIERDVQTNDGNVKVKLVKRFEERWKMFSKHGYLRCFEEVRQAGIEDSYGFQVLGAISKLEQNKGRKIVGTNQQITYSCRPEFIYSRKRHVRHIALIRYAEVLHPNILLEFFFGYENVTTDLCPAIRYNFVRDLFDPEYCFNESLAKTVISKGSILLVSKGDFQYRVTYTETELDYMNNKISKAHKDLYIFLKVIVSLFKKNFAPSSYSLKVTCIKHDLQCQNVDGSKNLLQCFHEITDDIIHWNRTGELPSIFDRRLNLFDSILYGKTGTHYSREIVAPIFKDVKKLCQNVNTTLPENFLEQIKTVVESWEQKYDTLQLMGGFIKPLVSDKK